MRRTVRSAWNRSALVDEDNEGCAATVCQQCQAEAAISDSADHLGDAELGECVCPCGGETFAVAIGFAMYDDTDVRWISVGLRCSPTTPSVLHQLEDRLQL